MPGHNLTLSLMACLLTACISISVETDGAPQPDFVTSTLAPTKAGFVPATLTPAPQATLLPATVAIPPSVCVDSAVLIRDVTVPDNTRMDPAEAFTKTWEFQNNGTCPWINYTLAFAAGDQMNAPLSAPIPDTVSKGIVQISVELTAPAVDGAYTGYFTLNDSSGKDIPIGIEKTFWVKILVGSGAVPTAKSSAAATRYVPPGGNSNCHYSSNAGYVSELISLINQARANADLPALTVNPQLSAAAQAHSADMACNNFLDHTGSDGSWIGDRLKAAGYDTYSYSEIIAIGTPQNAMDQWRADPPHWEIVMNPSGGEFGVGYAYYAGSDFGGYITADFAGP